MDVSLNANTSAAVFGPTLGHVFLTPSAPPLSGSLVIALSNLKHCSTCAGTGAVTACG